MVSEKQIKSALKRTHKTAVKFASLETEYAQAQKKYKNTGKHVKRSLITRYQNAEHNYKQAVSKYKTLYAKFIKNLSPDQLRV
jgi:hypothetical protein